MIEKLLAAIIILACISGCHASSPEKENPRIEKGVLSLETWHFQSDGPVRLSGDWEFYWNQLLESRDFSSTPLPVKTGYLNMPGMWNDFELDGQTLPGIGFATLRTTLRLNQAPQELAFKIQDVYSAYTIFVNGEKIGSVGRIAKNRGDHFDQNLPQVFSFKAREKELEIIFQISNQTTLYGGSPQIIFVGLKDSIQQKREKSLALDLFIIGGILIMGFYHFGLFIMRRKEKSSLYFMFHCLSVALYGSVTGECLLPFLFPTIGMDMVMRIVLFSAASAILWLMTFIRSIIPFLFPKTLLRINNAVMAISCISALIAPTAVYLQVHVAFQMVMLFMLLAAIIILVRGVFNRQIESTVLLSGFLLLTLTGLNDVLYFHALIETTYLVPLGLFIFIFAQALLLFVRFNRSFNLIEVITGELDKKNRELSRLDQLKDDFLSNTSHELRTPLSGIIGIAESVAAGAAGAVTSETQNRMSLITSSGKRLANLIDDLLDFSKLRNSNIQLYLTSLDLGKEIDGIISLMHMLAQAKGLTLNFSHPETPIFVAADRNRLHQILINLVGNAIKFTKSGGISVKAEANMEFATITVSDTGIGIPLDKQDRIFKNFERLEAPDVREQPGAGLGLAITKSLIELQQGHIELTSAPGKGSEFRFTLPITHLSAGAPISESFQDSPFQDQPTVSRATQVPLPTLMKEFQEDPANWENTLDVWQLSDYPELQNTTVLAVDDDPVNLTVIHDFLLLSRAVVKKAASGSECLSILESWKPDIVLLDIMMPGMSGFETAEKIRKQYGKNELPIIFLTAKDGESDLVHGFAVEANDYLTKPISRNNLCTRIHFHVSMVRQAEVLRVANEQIKHVFNNSVEGIFQFSENQRIVFVNKAMATLFGFDTPESMLTAKPQLPFLFENPEDFETIYQQLGKGTRFSHQEFRFLRPDGTTFWGTIAIQALPKPQHQPVLLQGMIFDTTESHDKAEAERQREVAEKGNKAKSEFLANITHELRSPMQGILGYSKLGIDKVMNLSQKQLEDYFQEIYSSGNRLLNLINDLLDLSKLEFNKAEYIHSREKLSQVINIILGEFGPLIQEKQLNIHFTPPKIDDTASFDVNKIGQVIRNLLGNAIKFSNTDDTIEIHLTKNKTHLKMTIRDSGIGIPEGELDSIFDKFTQSSRNKSRAGGTGLGLAISKGIIKDHQGDIWAEHNTGGGAVFNFTIPLSKEN